MKRRSLLKWLGLAPVVAPAAVASVSAVSAESATTYVRTSLTTYARYAGYDDLLMTAAGQLSDNVAANNALWDRLSNAR